MIVDFIFKTGEWAFVGISAFIRINMWYQYIFIWSNFFSNHWQGRMGIKMARCNVNIYNLDLCIKPTINMMKERNISLNKWKDRLTKWKIDGMKWNESGFRPPLCTCRLNWARRTSWGWWDDWDDNVLQTQDSKFEPWRSEAEHATSRSQRLPTILTFIRGWGRNIFCFFQTAETGNRIPNSGMKGSGANHYPRAPAQNRWHTPSQQTHYVEPM